jgi:hypothetical protein
MAEVLWLASYPKSGNTWLRAFLANLLFNPNKPFNINQLPKVTFSDAMGGPYTRLAGKPTEELTPDEVMRLRPRVQRVFANQKVDLILVKTHSAIAAIEGMPLFDLSAARGAIYVLRNPFDVAVSYARHFGKSLTEAVETLCSSTASLNATKFQVWQFTGSWSDHFQSWTEQSDLDVLLIRYEDMVRNPLPTFTRVADFVGFPDDDARVRKAIRFSSFRILAAQEQKGGFVETSPKAGRFFHQGRIGNGLNELSKADIDQLLVTHGDMMRRCGYLDESGQVVL